MAMLRDAGLGERCTGIGPRQGSVRLGGFVRRAVCLRRIQKEVTMANVVRYDPFDLLEGVMKSVLRPGYEAAQGRQSGAWNGNIPIDVTENDRAYFVLADLPGVK